jgi:hypothetical protein
VSRRKEELKPQTRRCSPRRIRSRRAKDVGCPTSEVFLTGGSVSFFARLGFAHVFAVFCFAIKPGPLFVINVRVHTDPHHPWSARCRRRLSRCRRRGALCGGCCCLRFGSGFRGGRRRGSRGGRRRRLARCRRYGGRLIWRGRLTLHNGDAGQADYRNKRNKFGTHTASLEKRYDRSQRISLTKKRVTMGGSGLKEVRIKQRGGKAVPSRDQ